MARKLGWKILFSLLSIVQLVFGILIVSLILYYLKFSILFWIGVVFAFVVFISGAFNILTC
jgi:hypothetical protein